MEERAEEQRGMQERSALIQLIPAPKLTLLQVDEPAGLCPAV